MVVAPYSEPWSIKALKVAPAIYATQVLPRVGGTYNSDSTCNGDTIVCYQDMLYWFGLTSAPEKIFLIGSENKRKLKTYLRTIYNENEYSRLLKLHKMHETSCSYYRKRFLRKKELVSMYWTLSRVMKTVFTADVVYGAIVFVDYLPEENRYG